MSRTRPRLRHDHERAERAQTGADDEVHADDECAARTTSIPERNYLIDRAARMVGRKT
jgi:hypothetical protein